MKKFLATLCTAMLLFTGCGGSGQQAVDKPGNNFSGKEVQLGMITRTNTDETKMDSFIAKIEEAAGVKDTHNRPKFYDSLTEMQMGIESGAIEQISLYKCVANYLIATNKDKYETVPNESFNKITDAFCFAVRKDDVALKAELDKAIDAMKSDGTLDKLINEYITNVNADNIPAVTITKIEGVDTIKVGVTGDLPPLDLIMPDNSPAGFNTAMLAEISKRINKNIEPVQIKSGARAAALQSNLIDVVFWVIVPVGNDNMPADIDKPEGLELSQPYFKDNIALIKLKDKG